MKISKKVILLGHFGVGKTSLIKRFIFEKFSEEYHTTIGVKVDKKVIQIDEIELTMIIWDIEGGAVQSRLPQSYFLGAHGIFYVFDLMRPSTYSAISEETKYFRDLLPKAKFQVIANKVDLLSEDEIKSFEQEFSGQYDFFSSAKSGENVEEAFRELGKIDDWMNFQELKSSILSERYQVARIDRSGKLIASCHTLIDLRSFEGKHVLSHFHVFTGLENSILSLDAENSRFYLPMIEFEHGGELIPYNLEFCYFDDPKNETSAEPEIIWIISQVDEFHLKLRKIQQERNDSVILLEKIKNQETLLRRYNEKLEMVNVGLDRFAYIVSHDLKSPLRAISNLASWIKEGIEEEDFSEVSEHLELMSGRVKRMEGLIEGILQYSRAGRESLVAETVDLNTLVREIVDSEFHFAGVRFEIAENLPIIVAIRTSLQQVFSNLISNAVKYGADDDCLVQLSCTEEEEHWKFAVKDNGPGIDARFHEKIFEIFQTLQPRDTIESTGIGLSIVQKIVEEAGGKVWVESELGAGATFFVSWPKA